MNDFKLLFLIIIISLYFLNSDSWDLRRKPQGKKCDEHIEFTCGSGECIEADNICDGKEDCADGSDETDACRIIRCQAFLFRCNYGACINSILACDGNKDCKDNSDETSPICKNKTENNHTEDNSNHFECKKDFCILPPFPQNGIWRIYGTRANKTGEIVPKNTVITHQCNAGFKLYPTTYASTCNSDRHWGELPKCMKTCSKLETTNYRSASCAFDGNKTSCENAYEGSIALLKCPNFNESIPLEKNKQISLSFCKNGDWVTPLPECKLNEEPIPIVMNVFNFYVFQSDKQQVLKNIESSKIVTAQNLSSENYLIFN